jgi:hypothetical protein
VPVESWGLTAVSVARRCNVGRLFRHGFWPSVAFLSSSSPQKEYDSKGRGTLVARWRNQAGRQAGILIIVASVSSVSRVSNVANVSN